MGFTQEEIEQSISAAFDSVILIKQLNLIVDKTDDDLAILDRNIRHIEIMLNKDWFVSSLTSEQLAELNTIIA